MSDPKEIHKDRSKGEFDASRVRDWVVSSTGFWCLGSVSIGEYMAEFRGTWYQARRRVRELQCLEAKHATEKSHLYWNQQREYNELLKSPMNLVKQIR